MCLGGMVHHDVDDDADAALTSEANEPDELIKSSEPRIHTVVVRDIVAVVQARRRIERQEPKARHSECLKIVEAAGQADEVADPVAVAVRELLDVYRIDHRIGVPRLACHEVTPYLFIASEARCWAAAVA